MKIRSKQLYKLTSLSLDQNGMLMYVDITSKGSLSSFQGPLLSATPPACILLCVTLSHCHSVTLSHCHTVTLSLCHTVTLSLCHTVTLSHCHSVTLSRCPTLSWTDNRRSCFISHLGEMKISWPTPVFPLVQIIKYILV